MVATPTRTLVLVRHAKSSWDLDVEDHERPLSGRGRRDGVEIGRTLASLEIHPDLVLCSTATRTRETWDRAVRGGVRADDVRYLGAIYHGWVPELVKLLRAIPESVGTALVLGHAPGIPDLVEYLAERDHSSADWDRMTTKFPTAAMAILTYDGPWADIGQSLARLDAFEVPRAQ
jgi:phosphohistidine phosphatase